ncbi:MAG: envelope stress response membrane protein PspC [Robiginitomaculum sp.]|nr:envelope stress response membrane protein PspC [Robiginitomaculum sp.]MDQ7078818.1 envelope stress response membrane protein PspC [Robiginitomaculum sp.]
MSKDFSRSPNPHRLYRNRTTGVWCGVCAGLADYFNIDVVLVRILWALSFFIAGPFTFIAYIVACIALPVRGEKPPKLKPEEDDFWRGVERRPEVTFSNLRYQFRDLEDRLADLERTVTSKEWKLRRQFRDLET